MKKILLLTCLFLGINSQVQAQATANLCDSLRIDSVWLVQAGVNRIAVRLHFAGSSSDFINYPYFPVIFNQFGDTIAWGEMDYFGQNGGTAQDYLNITLLNELPPVMYFQLRYNSDSCSFVYPAASAVQTMQKGFPDFYPNPANDRIYLRTEADKEISFSISDYTGRRLKTGRVKKEIPVNELPSGMYFLEIDRLFRRAMVKQ